MNLPFQCRSCGSVRSELIVDLGLQPLANNLLRLEDLTKPEPRFPLRLLLCQDCGLLQISDLVPPVELFSEYLYFSSFSDAMLRHAREAAGRYITEFELSSESLVVEIASNDGYLLQNFAREKIGCLGIEPAANVARVAQEKGIETLVKFFSRQTAEKLGRSADLILGNNVFAHAPEINDFTAGLQALLKPHGRIVLEFPYAGDMVEKTEFDTIYHEHVFYFFLAPLLPLFARHGLEIFRVERLPIHGGSLRIFAGHAGDYPIENSVIDLFTLEQQEGAVRVDFAANVTRIKVELLDLLRGLKSQGHRIAAYGASAKGSTLLNYVTPESGTLDFVADRSTHKQSRFTPGLHLPIVGPEELATRMPAYTLLLTWNFASEIFDQQREYRDRGGRFIIPVPRPSIV